MKVLECSSKGDKRFSAFYAMVEVNGITASIENHYQLSKRIGDFTPKTWRDVKGKKPTHFVVNGKSCELKLLSQWYELLWVKYFINNPELLAYAQSFDEYNDMFKGKALNCQSDVIRKICRHSVRYVFNDCVELVNILRK